MLNNKLRLKALIALATLFNCLQATAAESTTEEVIPTPINALELPDIAPAEEFEIISNAKLFWSGEEVIKDYHPKLRQAQHEAKGNNWKLAEKLFLEALNRSLTKEERYIGLLQMAAMYQREGEFLKHSTLNKEFLAYFGDRKIVREHLMGSAGYLVKAISVYEKFVTLYEDDELVPVVNLQLGKLYRQLGANELALSRFYNVINSAINIKPANIPSYRKVTNRAKQEIADTYFLSGDYKQAVEFFNRLRLINLSNDKHQEALFKKAYSLYVLGQSTQSKNTFTELIKQYPDSILAPESHYLLAEIYSSLNQPQKAIEQVTQLITNPQISQAQDEAIWFYWQKKAGNEIANEFYEQGDYLSALKIYQKMWELDQSPDWRASVMYQIGLAYEHLAYPEKAQDAFVRVMENNLWDIENEKDAIQKYAAEEASEEVKALQEMASWHTEHIDWNTDTRNRLQRLLIMGDAGS